MFQHVVHLGGINIDIIEEAENWIVLLTHSLSCVITVQNDSFNVKADENNDGTLYIYISFF